MIDAFSLTSRATVLLMSTASVLIAAGKIQGPRHSLPLPTDPAPMQAAQRFRYQVFTAESGCGPAKSISGLDADRFDEYCDHLLVPDANNLAEGMAR